METSSPDGVCERPPGSAVTPGGGPHLPVQRGGPAGSAPGAPTWEPPPQTAESSTQTCCPLSAQLHAGSAAHVTFQHVRHPALR